MTINLNEGPMRTGGTKPYTTTPRPATYPRPRPATTPHRQPMRPDEAVEAVLSRVRIEGSPIEFRCDDCGRSEPIMLLCVEPDPWKEPGLPASRFKALCQACYSCTRKGEQLELEL